MPLLVDTRFMITHVKPLTYGRMGNYLFQVAAAIGYALRNNIEFTVPSVTTPGRQVFWNPVYLKHLVKKDFNSEELSITLKEEGLHYQQLPWKEEWRGNTNVILDGYWQTEKYFAEFRDEIIRLFGFPWKGGMNGTVSVHVRRGDYLKWTKKHPAVPAAWIEEAMRQFPHYQFIFFSDDMAWCKAVFGRRKDVTFFQGKDEVEDLTRMTWCEHHICSASTFSWWGAWLNQNAGKQIIIPKLWFVPGWGGVDPSDIVPADWRKM